MTRKFPLTPAQQRTNETLQRTGQIMMSRVLDAIEVATNNARDELKAAGFRGRMPSSEYFAAVALQGLFLRQCGADSETMEGEDPRLAARILENGHKISLHYWQGKSAEAAAMGDSAMKIETPENVKPDRFELAEGAHRSAIRTVLQALTDHASAADPDFRPGIMSAIDDYITRLAPQSELERDFAERARAQIETFIRPPGL